MKALATLLFILCATCLSAQDLSGFWKGTLLMGGSCFAVNNIELQLHISGNEVTGDSYHYESVNFYVKKKLSGSYNPKQKTLSLQEGIVTTFHIPPTCKICIKHFDLQYSADGNLELLTGTWNGRILGTDDLCSGGPITLSRVKESAFKDVPEISVDTGTLRLDFYDNAVIDGDSITVLVDKNVVVSHQLLGTKPITTYITIDLHHSFHEIEMVAENLGSIPPNTALLIITAGEKKYQLSLSSTKTKSAMVRFIYEKKSDTPPRSSP